MSFVCAVQMIFLYTLFTLMNIKKKKILFFLTVLVTEKKGKKKETKETDKTVEKNIVCENFFSSEVV